MTLPRNLWNTTFDPGQKEVFIKNWWCFGWIVQQVILPVTAKMVTVSTNTVARTKSPNLALYVRGRAEVTNDETGGYPDRLPGLFTGLRPDHPKGITTIKAVEETELWCFNYLINKRNLPELTPIFITQNNSYQQQENELLFICAGSVNEFEVGQEITTNSKILIANQDTYMFKLENRRV